MPSRKQKIHRTRKRGGLNTNINGHSPRHSPRHSPQTWKKWLIKHKYTIGAGIAVITTIVAAERLRDPNSSVSNLKNKIFNKIGAEVPTTIVKNAVADVHQDEVPVKTTTTPVSTHPNECAKSDQSINYNNMNFNILVYAVNGHQLPDQLHYTGLYKSINNSGHYRIFKKENDDTVEIIINVMTNIMHLRDKSSSISYYADDRKLQIHNFSDFHAFQSYWFSSLRLCPVLRDIVPQGTRPFIIDRSEIVITGEPKMNGTYTLFARSEEDAAFMRNDRRTRRTRDVVYISFVDGNIMLRVDGHNDFKSRPIEIKINSDFNAVKFDQFPNLKMSGHSTEVMYI